MGSLERRPRSPAFVGPEVVALSLCGPIKATRHSLCAFLTPSGQLGPHRTDRIQCLTVASSWLSHGRDLGPHWASSSPAPCSFCLRVQGTVVSKALASPASHQHELLAEGRVRMPPSGPTLAASPTRPCDSTTQPLLFARTVHTPATKGPRSQTDSPATPFPRLASGSPSWPDLSSSSPGGEVRPA